MHTIRALSLPAATRSPTRLFSSTPSSTTHKKTILSGVQPTGSLHLGNYLGSVRQWVPLQDSYSCNFCIVDLHAITTGPCAATLTESTLSTAALYIAAGIDPSKSNVFVQSHVSSHSEVGWLLQCTTPLGWAQRMIQYKEKSAKSQDIGLGLLNYPVLMAADILIYGAEVVPVGEDQRQHLELTREIARRFNDQYCKGNAYKKACKKAGFYSGPVFREPEALIVTGGSRVMSLTDGTSKMSKSAPSDLTRINMLDTPEQIVKKIKSCKTDTSVGIAWNDPARPEATNLLNIYQACSGRDKDSIVAEVESMSWGEFKPKLADAVVEHLRPIQGRYYEVRKEEGELERILKMGAVKANEMAKRTADHARLAMGFLPEFK